MSEYESTSERLCEATDIGTEQDYLLYLFHVATYEFAREFVAGKSVLDYGCGTGYGTQRLASSAAQIVGIDISEEAIRFAESTYLPAVSEGSTLDYRVVQPIEQAPLPFEDGAFDTVLSFQVIEHVPSVEKYLAEIRRVLKPGGTFVCATPDRRWRLFPWQRPFNRFHLDEWDPAGLADVLRPTFASVDLYGMGAPPHLMEVELRRCRRLRIAALPFTFPGIPEKARVAGIDGLKRLRGGRARGNPTAGNRLAGMDHRIVTVDRAVEPSTNIIAVCQ